MEVSAEGQLTWDVPDDYRESSVDVIINVGDGDGQTVYDTFTLHRVEKE